MPIKCGEVLIFKAQANDDDDGLSYAKLMENEGFIPKTVPVLDFEFCNLDILKQQLKRPHDFSGIIFTSPRTVKALVKSIGSVENLSSEWNKLPMFVVGNATKRILMNDLGLIGECGTTENVAGLVEVIVKRTYDHPLLFPCSDMRRDTLPVSLKEKGVSLTETIVYSTQQNAQLEVILKDVTDDGTMFPEYMVFFSPSGVKYTLPFLLKWNAPLHDIRILAIGNTTSSALKEAKVEVWSCSSKPSPQNLLDALLGKT